MGLTAAVLTGPAGATVDQTKLSAAVTAGAAAAGKLFAAVQGSYTDSSAISLANKFSMKNTVGDVGLAQQQFAQLQTDYSTLTAQGQAVLNIGKAPVTQDPTVTTGLYSGQTRPRLRDAIAQWQKMATDFATESKTTSATIAATTIKGLLSQAASVFLSAIAGLVADMLDAIGAIVTAAIEAAAKKLAKEIDYTGVLALIGIIWLIAKARKV